MKKILLAGLLLVLTLSCVDRSLPRVDGFWQLKTIEKTDTGEELSIDTIFFGFQRQTLFSHTTVSEIPNYEEPIYGYISFPSEKQITIEIHGPQQTPKYLEQLFWNKAEATFDIRTITSKKMQLQHENIIYHLIKY